MAPFVLKPAPGADLLGAIAGAFPTGAGWVRGIGVVRDVELVVEAGGHTGGAMRLDGAAQLVSLDAHVDGDSCVAACVLAAPFAGNGVVLAGRLLAATVVDATLRCEALDGVDALDASVPPRAPAASVAPALSPAPVDRPASRPAPAPAARPAPAPAQRAASPTPASPAPASPPAARPAEGASSWAAVAALSQRVASASPDEPDPVEVEELERGVSLEHPTLGRCTFLRPLGTDAAQVRLRNGSPQKLMLRVFDIVPTDDPRVFTLRKRE